MRNDSEEKLLSAVCLDSDCNVGVIDEDGDGIPDFVVLRIRWVVSAIVTIASTITYLIV